MNYKLSLHYKFSMNYKFIVTYKLSINYTSSLNACLQDVALVNEPFLVDCIKRQMSRVQSVDALDGLRHGLCTWPVQRLVHRLTQHEGCPRDRQAIVADIKFCAFHVAETIIAPILDVPPRPRRQPVQELSEDWRLQECHH